MQIMNLFLLFCFYVGGYCFRDILNMIQEEENA